jgi:hypothetical protein
MKKNINSYLAFYLFVLFLFGLFFLFIKHSVGNDSTISEWLINYKGGFTKRGIIGEICIWFANLFSANLRDIIFGFQTVILGVYFILIYFFLRNIKVDRILLLSIFTPIFILYPIAEIEVLARKEVFIFIILLIYLFIPINKIGLQNIYKIIVLPLSVLIWEPVVFFLLFWISLDIINNKYQKINLENLTKLLPYLPAVSVAFYIIFNPMTLGQHDQMVEFLANNFNEKCYMSCDLLKSKSTIFQQFQVNFSKYSFEVFLRYFLIIIIGFGPLFILLFYSKLKDKNLIFFKNFNNLLIPFLFILSPVLVLFAMGYDWGRWVNISYVFSIISYVYLYKKRKIFISENKIQNNKLNKVNKKIFILFFVIYCFGWNPKTVITGDVASFPGYRIPYKVFKLLNQQ